MSRHGSSNAGHEPADEQALRRGLHAEPLSPAAMQRIRAATEAEWRAATRVQRKRSPWLPMAAAATLAMAAIGAGWWVVSDGARVDGAVFGQLERTTGAVNESLSFGRVRPIAAGSPLRAGQRLQVVGNALVNLPGGGTLRLASATSLQILGAETARLERGVVYVDIPPQSSANADFAIATDAGEFAHLGTQFEVAVQGERTQLRVREGEVAWRRGELETRAVAGTSLLIEGDGRSTRQSIATTGRDWAWAEALAPDFDIENRPLAEFLQWVARETGRRLVIADAATEKRIAATILHGSIQGLTSLEALSTVMQTTALHFDLLDGVIRVSSTGALPPVSN
ncbi:MAG: FecR family protein [Steroidobacteraceae bacterium]